MKTISRLFSCPLLFLAIAFPIASRAQENVTDHPRAADEAGAKEALDGWWTEAHETVDQRLQWFRDARFGCFIHWGVYATPAGEFEGKRGGSYSEHIMRQLKIPLKVYTEKIVAPFNPEKFNADEWVKLIKGAGMRYLVITSKHHDGFAMWPSDVSKFNIRDATGFKRDPMQELAEACHREGIHFGFYYSHAFDWEDPNAPGNDWDYQNPGGDLGLFGGKTWYDSHPELVDRVQKYVDGKAIPQLQELIKKYHPEIFWFDVGGKLPFSEQLRIVKAVRAADPNVVVNGRAARGMGKNWGDYVDTADNPAEVRGHDGDWEAIPTLNSSYGYNKYDNNYKTPEFCVRLLAKIVAKGGNMLLNIGPMGDGTIDSHATGILTGIAKWASVNIESIHGAGRTPLDRQAWGDSTLKGNTLYLHVFDWPSTGRLIVGGLQSDASNAYLLSDPEKKPLKTERLNANDLVVHVPKNAPDDADSVVVLESSDAVKAKPGRLLDPTVKAVQLLAFDADASGKGLAYGDGKAGRYYVSGFKDASQKLSWKYRVNQPATFDVSVKYNTTSDEQTGAYDLKFGGQTLHGHVKPSKAIQEAKLGQIKLKAGEGTLEFAPAEVKGDDLMQLFEIVLTPAKS